MKNLTKSLTIMKRSYYASDRKPVPDKPIKCSKPILDQSKVQSISKLIKPKSKNSYTNIKQNEKTSESKDKNNFMSSSSTRFPKSNQSQNNWFHKSNPIFPKISRDNESICIDMSESYTKVKADKAPKITKKHVNNINCFNICNKKYPLKGAPAPYNDTSTFLNYDLGNTNNYTQIDEILLDNNQNGLQPQTGNNPNEKVNKKEETKAVDEMEIDLSMASICFNSFLQNSKDNDVPKNLRYTEGEQKKEIYSLTIKENTLTQKPKYCLTDHDISATLKKDQPKKIRNNAFNSTQPISKTSDNEINNFYRKVPCNTFRKTDKNIRNCHKK